MHFIIILLFIWSFQIFAQQLDLDTVENIVLSKKLKNELLDNVMSDEIPPFELGSPVRRYLLSCGEFFRDSSKFNDHFRKLKKENYPLCVYSFPVYKNGKEVGLVSMRKKPNGWQMTGSEGANYYVACIAEISRTWPAEKGYHPQIFTCDGAIEAFRIPELPFSNLTPFATGIWYESHQNLYKSDRLIRKSKQHNYILSHVEQGKNINLEYERLREEYLTKKLYLGVIGSKILPSEFEKVEKFSDGIKWFQEYYKEHNLGIRPDFK